MNAQGQSDPSRAKNRTIVERKSERELVITRIFSAPARIVFDAWTKPELLLRWWVPTSCGVSFISCKPLRVTEATQTE
jgi:hypothetical protein